MEDSLELEEWKIHTRLHTHKNDYKKKTKILPVTFRINNITHLHSLSTLVFPIESNLFAHLFQLLSSNTGMTSIV